MRRIFSFLSVVKIARCGLGRVFRIIRLNVLLMNICNISGASLMEGFVFASIQ